MSHRPTPLLSMVLFFILSPFLVAIATNLGWGINGMVFACILAASAVPLLSSILHKIRQVVTLTWIPENEDDADTTDEEDFLEDCPPISSRRSDPFLVVDIERGPASLRETPASYFQGYQDQSSRGDRNASTNYTSVSPSVDYEQPMASYPEDIPPPLQ